VAAPSGVADSSSNGTGPALSLVKLGSEPAGLAVVAGEQQAYTFDDNVIVAEAPGGEWSRFKSYSVLAVRHPARCVRIARKPTRPTPYRNPTSLSPPRVPHPASSDAAPARAAAHC